MALFIALILVLEMDTTGTLWASWHCSWHTTCSTEIFTERCMANCLAHNRIVVIIIIVKCLLDTPKGLFNLCSKI